MAGSELDQRAHEEGIISSFIQPSGRERARTMLFGRGRRKWVQTLPHFMYLKSSRAELIAPASQTPAAIEQILRKRGAPDVCWIVSEDSDLDGVALPLGAALERVVGAGFGTFISCVPGRLGYFEDEEAGQRYLLSFPQ